MNKLVLAIESGRITDGEVLFLQLNQLKSGQIPDMVSRQQFAELSEMVNAFQDVWMDEPVSFFQPIQDFLKAIDLEVYNDFSTVFDLWYYYEAPEQKYEATVATKPLFSAPKLTATGEVYNCLLTVEQAQNYLNKAIQFARDHNMPVPKSCNEPFIVTDGLEVGSELIYSGVGTDKAVYTAIQLIQEAILNNAGKEHVLCLRRFSNSLKPLLKSALGKEVYLTNCTLGKLADLLDRPETWSEFTEHFKQN